MDATIPLIGFVVGALIGLTGMGGGALMTPALVLIAGVPPMRAVGSDLVYAAVTKLFGAREHLRLGTVDGKVVAALATGSVPAALISVAVLGRYVDRADTERFVAATLGWVLIAGAVVVMAGRRRRPRRPGRFPRGRLLVTGALVGALVAVTSVGSGTLVVAALGVMTGLAPRRVVGTDVAHALILTAVAGLGHVALGTVDMRLTGLLLLGSIPGVILGSRMTLRLSEPVLRALLAAALLVTGVSLRRPPPGGEQGQPLPWTHQVDSIKETPSS